MVSQRRLTEYIYQFEMVICAEEFCLGFRFLRQLTILHSRGTVCYLVTEVQVSISSIPVLLQETVTGVVGEGLKEIQRCTNTVITAADIVLPSHFMRAEELTADGIFAPAQCSVDPVHRKVYILFISKELIV